MTHAADGNLIQTYLQRRFFISTAYRRASTIEELYYYETLIWFGSPKDNYEKLVFSESSGSYSERALKRHFEIILLLKTMRENVSHPEVEVEKTLVSDG